MAADKETNSKLRADYIAAEAEERAAWRLVGNLDLQDAERGKAYARWQVAAALTRVLAIKLHDAAAQPPSEGPS